MDTRRTSTSIEESDAEKKLDAEPRGHHEEHNSLSRSSSEINEQDLDRDVEKNEPQPAPLSQNDAVEDPFLVKFDGENDKDNPHNFSTWYKAWITLQLGFLALSAAFGSSVISPAENVLSAYLGVSKEVMVLAVSLYVLGFAIGPIVWAPVSEVYGRKWSLLPPLIVVGLFSIGTAVSTTAASVFITRFCAGLFACSPVSNVSAALGDLYTPKERGTAVAFYAVMVVGGPTLGPVAGAAITANKHLGWRWTMYIQAIIVFAVSILAFFCIPELYPPVILKRKAQRLRKETGDARYWHPHEQKKMTPSNILTKYFSRPLRMLFTEPMVTAMACYASFVYAMLYLTLEVFPIVFLEERKWGLVVSTLPFLGLFVGVLCAVGINLANQPFYHKAMAKNNNRPVPEARLPPMFLGIILFVIGLFWFGWTAAPRYPWILPVIATAFIGAGFNIVFQQAINFLVDTYTMYAASAVAANTMLRSLMAAGLPLAAGPMFHNMGVGPAASVLGGILCLALPMPFIFGKYGPALRAKSKFAQK